MRPTVFVLATLACLAGCGGPQAPADEAQPDPGITGGITGEITGPPKPWADMDYEERKQYMMRTVRPTMAKLFRAHDPAGFAQFSCSTCHGDDAHARRHEMPNALPALWPTGSIQQKRTVDRHPKTVKFMFNEVRPAMRDLLGLEDYDPETRTGFGCFNCHPHGDAPDEPAAEPAPAEPEPAADSAAPGTAVPTETPDSPQA